MLSKNFNESADIVTALLILIAEKKLIASCFPRNRCVNDVDKCPGWGWDKVSKKCVKGGTTTMADLVTNNCLSMAIDGEWSEWVSDGACTTTCGPGIQTFARECNNPEPANGGADCPGDGMPAAVTSLLLNVWLLDDPVSR